MHIIQQTSPIFNKKGYAGASMKDLTGATKLTTGSIYGNFDNKEEVALAALDFNLEALEKRVKSKTKLATTAKAELVAYIAGYRAMVNESRVWGGCPMQNALVDADDTNEKIRKKAATALLSKKKELMHIIERGKSTGEFRPGIDSESTAVKILSLIEFSFLINSATMNGKEMDKVLGFAEEVIHEVSAA